MSENSEKEKLERLSRVSWVAVVIALSVGSIFAIAFLPTSSLLPIAVALLVTIIIIQITEIRERSSINRVIGIYEQVRKDEDLHKMLSEITTSYFKVKDVIGHARYKQQAKNLIEKCRDGLNALSLGRLEVPAEGEASFTIELVSECRKELLAVSYKDEEWWSDALGEKYLEKHKEFINNKGRAERVFIIQGSPKGDGLSKLRETLDKQASLGISVYTVYEEGSSPLPEVLRRDFVIYDDKYVRTAEFESGIVRRATLSVNSADITLAKQMFEELRARSRPWQPAVGGNPR